MSEEFTMPLLRFDQPTYSGRHIVSVFRDISELAASNHSVITRIQTGGLEDSEGRPITDGLSMRIWMRRVAP